MLITVFSHEIFRSERDLYCIQKVKVVKSDIPEFLEGYTICIKGYNLPTWKIPYHMNGRVVRDPKHGLQFEVSVFVEAVDDNDKNAVIKFLTCGAVKGIGKINASRIYNRFGSDTLRILNEDPLRLKEIVGIGTKKALAIAESYRQNHILSDVMQELLPYGISTRACREIAKKFETESLSVIRNTPFRLCGIRGLDFGAVDSIALKMGYDPCSIDRIEAAILFALYENELTGNCGMDSRLLKKSTLRLLGRQAVPDHLVNKVSRDLINDRKVAVVKKEDSVLVFLPQTYMREDELAEKIAHMTAYNCLEIPDIDGEIAATQNTLGIRLHPSQADAVKTALENSFSIITGGPGTGKTTILRCICDIYSRCVESSRLILLAPTGKAARRMTESTGIPAHTIHRALGIRKDDSESTVYDLNAELIIVDEASMIDLRLMSNLVLSIPCNARLILVGDADQLPSIGCGAVLNDCINSGCIPVARLTKIFRQSEDSQIIANAHAIKDGSCKLKQAPDFRFIPVQDDFAAADLAEEVFIEEAAHFGIKNTILLCPAKKNASGVFAMNTRLQERLNPDGDRMDFRGGSFRVGDPVMQLENRIEASNGEVGFVSEHFTDDDGECITVMFDDCTVKYHKEDLDQLILAYASTIHKSQGEEYPSVVMVITDAVRIMLKRNLIYTGVTRAKKKVTIVGQGPAVGKAIRNADSTKRITLLSEKLKMYRKRILEDNPFE